MNKGLKEALIKNLAESVISAEEQAKVVADLPKYLSSELKKKGADVMKAVCDALRNTLEPMEKELGAQVKLLDDAMKVIGDKIKETEKDLKAKGADAAVIKAAIGAIEKAELIPLKQQKFALRPHPDAAKAKDAADGKNFEFFDSLGDSTRFKRTVTFPYQTLGADQMTAMAKLELLGLSPRFLLEALTLQSYKGMGQSVFAEYNTLDVKAAGEAAAFEGAFWHIADVKKLPEALQKAGIVNFTQYRTIMSLLLMQGMAARLVNKNAPSYKLVEPFLKVDLSKLDLNSEQFKLLVAQLDASIPQAKALIEDALTIRAQEVAVAQKPAAAAEAAPMLLSAAANAGVGAAAQAVAAAKAPVRMEI